METSTRQATDLSAAVAKEVRVLLVRRDMKQTELAARLGVTEMWLSRRLRGAQAMDLNDLARIAEALDVRVADLLPHEAEGRTVVTAGEPRRQTTVAKLHLTDQPHPNGHRNRAAPAPGTRRPARLFPAHA